MIAMSIAVIDEFFKREEEEKALCPNVKKKSSRRSRNYYRRMFLTKEKNLPIERLRNANYGYRDNCDYVLTHISDLAMGKNVSSHGIKMEVVSKQSDDEFDVLVNNFINNTSDMVHVIHANWRKRLWYWEVREHRDFRATASHPVYFRKYYPNFRAGKFMANRAVRNYKAYDEEGVEIAPSNGGWYRKIFDSLKIRDD